MADFTVLLMVPDTLTTCWPLIHDYHVIVETENLENPHQASLAAVAKAREDLMDEYDESRECGIDPVAIQVIAVYPGHLDDCNPELDAPTGETA